MGNRSHPAWALARRGELVDKNSTEEHAAHNSAGADGSSAEAARSSVRAARSSVGAARSSVGERNTAADHSLGTGIMEYRFDKHRRRSAGTRSPKLE